MNMKSLTILSIALFTAGISTQANVTHWRIVKGAYYLQSADNTPSVIAEDWGMFGVVETLSPGDATSVVITGGNIPGSIAYEFEDGEWSLDAVYANKAALDAVFPSAASYSIILSGGALGSLTQAVTYAADAYPNTPYLTGSDYSDCLALEAPEPFELNWNDSGIVGGGISLQINTGDELDEGDTIFELFQWSGISSTNLPSDLFVANSNYNGYIDFANADLQSGAGGFGIDGDVSFNTSMAFNINTIPAVSQPSVTDWRAVKEINYQQTADNTIPTTVLSADIYAEVYVSVTGEVTSVVMEGGNIAGSMAFSQEDADDEWTLYVDYPTQAALDAVFPSDADYSIILNGASLGTVTQQFSFTVDNYPTTPYLTGADFSDAQALDAAEPFELNWNAPGSNAVSLQILSGSVLDEGDTVSEFYSESFLTSTDLWNLFEANSNYNASLGFTHVISQSGSGGFGVPGDASFSKVLFSHIDTVIAAVGYDDFNDNSMDTNKWLEFEADPGEAFTETGGRLEYTSSGGDDLSVAWTWEGGDLSYTQDWSVAINVANFLDLNAITNEVDETYFGLVVLNDGINKTFSMEHIVSMYGRELATLATTNDVVLDEEVDIIEDYRPLNSSNVAMKISFDADTKLLTGAYSIGGDYMVTTNFSTAIWGLTETSVFTPAIYSGTDFVEAAPGQVYADNFRIYEGKTLSNEVDVVELEFLHSYGDGSIFLEGNFIKVDADTTHRVRDITFTTSGGISSMVTNSWEEGQILDWGVEVPLGFSTTWNAANDGDWMVTFGFFDGTYQSTVIPFTLEDGISPIPNLFYKPMFTAPSPVNGSTISSISNSFAWTAAGPNALFLSVDEIVDGNEIGELSMFYTNGISAESLAIVGITNAHPISITSAGPFVFAEGFHRMRINEGSGHVAYNNEGIRYTAVKQNESDIIFTITFDADSDNMDDDWEIEFFGGTNVLDGGTYDDFDKDGMLNVEEFIAGVNPANSNSVFAVEEPGPSPSGFVINWNSVEGRKYGVYWAKTLTNSFEFVTPGYLPYPQNSYTDTVHTVEGCGFYYIDVQLD